MFSTGFLIKLLIFDKDDVMQIYLARDNVQAGPYDLEQLNAMLQSGEVVGTDLIWHVGMANWQTVAQTTEGKPYYPNGAPNFLQNNQDNQNQRLSVSQLYGDKQYVTKQPSVDDAKHDALPLAQEKDLYASRLKRFGAFLLNILLFYLAMIPMQRVVLNSGIDIDQYQGQNFASTFAHSQELAMQMQTGDSLQAMMLSGLLLCGLLLIQFVLLMLKGQSLGKLIMGICVVDEQTYQNNIFANITRTILLLLIYLLAYYATKGLLAGILLSANYFLAGNNPKGQGWHDKLTKTVVINRKHKQSKFKK